MKALASALSGTVNTYNNNNNNNKAATQTVHEAIEDVFKIKNLCTSTSLNRHGLRAFFPFRAAGRFQQSV